MRRRTLVGVSLLYACPERGIAQIDTYCLAVGSTKRLRAKVQVLVAERNEHDPAKFLGIEDVFHVEGPLQSGGLLGRSTLCELKTRARARTLVAPVRLARGSAKWLCASPVYFVVACDGDYTVAAKLLVRRSTEGLHHVRRVAKSGAFIAALKRSGPFEPLDDRYHFLGFEGFQALAGDPTQGDPFERVWKRYRSLPKLRKMLMPARRIDAFFATRRARLR